MSHAYGAQHKQGKTLTAPAQLHFLVASLKATKTWIFNHIRQIILTVETFKYVCHLSDRSFLAHVSACFAPYVLNGFIREQK